MNRFALKMCLKHEFLHGILVYYHTHAFDISGADRRAKHAKSSLQCLLAKVWQMLAAVDSRIRAPKKSGGNRPNFREKKMLGLT